MMVTVPNSFIPTKLHTSIDARTGPSITALVVGFSRTEGSEEAWRIAIARTNRKENGFYTFEAVIRRSGIPWVLFFIPVMSATP
jgi:hypothetical protein